jgi:DNA-binding Lrp family transcriptional regulator
MHNEPAKQLDSKPVNDPSNYPHNNPVHEPANILVNDVYPVIQPVSDSINQPDYKPANYPANKPIHDPVNYPDNILVSNPVNEPVHHTTQKPTGRIDPELWYPFTEKQGRILLYLITAGGITNRQHISDDTGVNIATVKHTLRILVKEGYIGQIKLYVNHTQRGFTYNVNPQLCTEYSERLSGYPVNNPVSRRVNTPANYPANRPGAWSAPESANYPVKNTNSPFSSSSENQKTTTNVLSGPEMAYWVELGLKDRQVLKWCEEFNIDQAEIRQQLAWARWDLVNNDKEAEVKKDAINWFYGVLKRSAGCYLPAKGYQSPVEIRAARLRAQIDAEVKARSELDALEVEFRFQAVLNDPSGTEYQKLLSGLPEAMSGIKGRALESILRERFLAREG